ncbi:MAG TPA: hypothetical protein VMD30_01555 [Tepidisphaeraceae bacterium]|nr:hypothetical protein [Tepidisphaeraceae bacterium]
MSQTATTAWESLRTADSRKVEAVLRKEFPHCDAYQYNSAAIRVRVIDARFKGKSVEQRDAMVEPLLQKLPDRIVAQILNLLTIYPGESNKSLSVRLANLEFEEPTPSLL